MKSPTKNRFDASHSYSQLNDYIATTFRNLIIANEI